MVEKETKTSFGSYLRFIRIQNELTIQRISELTNISIDVIGLIETEDHRNLPEEVYVKGFLRLYAKELLIDEDKVISNYLNHLHNYRESLKADLSILKYDKDFWKRIISIIFIFGTLVYASTQILSVSEVDKPIDQKSIKVVKRSDETKKRLLELKIKAIEDTWVKIIIDDQPHKEYTLSTGDTIALKATRSYNVMIGSATAVVITFNGKPIATYGRTGQILNVVLP